MQKFKIQRYTTTVTIPQNQDTEDSELIGAGGLANDQLNGILKGFTVVAPNLTGSAFTLYLLGQRGETLFSKASMTKGVTTHVNQDANNRPLEIPLALQGVAPVRIKSTGTPDASGELTFSNDGALVDGETVTIGETVYRLKDTLAQAYDVLIEPDVKAQGLIDSGATGPLATETFVIGATTYTIVAALSSGPTVPNEILLEVDVDDTLQNIKDAINGEVGTIGTKYSVGTVANASVEATTLDDTAHTLLIQALEGGADGNAIVFTEDLTDVTFNGSGVLGGTQSGAWSGEATLENLADAINLEDGGGESGTKYHEDTEAHPDVTAGVVAANAMPIEANEDVDDFSAIVTETDADELSWAAETIEGGGEAAEREFTVDLLVDRG